MRGFLLAAFTGLCLVTGVAQADTSGVFSSTGPAEKLSSGEAIYRHVCQGCHMADGRGGTGAGANIPALANNSHLQSPYYPASIVLHGYGAMPWFSGMLDDSQTADVVNYIRSHFGNKYTDVLKPQDITPMRPVITEEED